MQHFDKIYKSIEKAINSPQKAHEVLTGFSGEKLLSTLINLANYNLDKNKIYLEVGVFQGLSLLSVAHSIPKNLDVFGIDNFAYFDEDGTNESIVKARKENLKLNNVKLINSDYEDALEDLSKYVGDKKVGVYFIDGPHDYRSQLMCLLLIQAYLSDDAIIIIDDCNYRHVRQANRDFLLTHKEYKLFFESYTNCHPNNMTDSEQIEARSDWWNGVNILVRDQKNILKTKLPPTHRDRTLYENEHILHCQKYPTLPMKILKYLKPIGDFAIKIKKSNIQVGQFNSLNTYSDNLKHQHFTQK